MAKGKSSQKMDDWISSLAAQASSADTNAGKVLSKAERKQKRAAKKARREAKPQFAAKQQKQQQQQRVDSSNFEAMEKLKLDRNRRRLKKLSQLLHALNQSHSSKNNNKKERSRPYVARTNSNKVSKHKRKRLQWNQETIQPRPCDYSGIGLARESLYVAFLDPSYVPKVEEEFRQHIPGFYGKQRTKAMKRQLDGNMLWRKLADKKQELPKKFKSMTPDERVEAMIESGML